MEDHVELLTVLKELHQISGFRISVHDTEFQEIAAYPQELGCFCGLVQQNEEARGICVNNDMSTFNTVRQSQKVYIYQCHFGLFEAVAPLYSMGQLMGYLMMGQLLDTFTASRDYVYQAALPYVEEKDALRRAVDRISVSTKEKMMSCITIMDICAKYITLSNRVITLKKDLAEEIKRYIYQNYRRKITIELLCKHFFCSRSTLMNAFKKNNCGTLNQYCNTVKMEKAAEILTCSQKGIREVAGECGFEDQNYFSKLFYKFYRMTPTEYRKRNSTTD